MLSGLLRQPSPAPTAFLPSDCRSKRLTGSPRLIPYPRSVSGRCGVHSVPHCVLGRLRISRTRLESTSIESQRGIVQQWADANSHRGTVNLRSCGRSANHISLIRHTRPGESRRRTGENRRRIAQVDSAASTGAGLVGRGTWWRRCVVDSDPQGDPQVHGLPVRVVEQFSELQAVGCLADLHRPRRQRVHGHSTRRRPPRPPPRRRRADRLEAGPPRC